MKFSMLDGISWILSAIVQIQTRQYALHPSSETRSAQDDLLPVLVDDFCAGDFQVGHGECRYCVRIALLPGVYIQVPPPLSPSSRSGLLSTSEFSPLAREASTVASSARPAALPDMATGAYQVHQVNERPLQGLEYNAGDT